MHVAPAYADRFCLVGKDAAEREAVIQMQEDSQFFCLAQCQKVIDVERVSSQMVLPGGCQHRWLQLLCLRGFLSLRGVKAEAASLLPMGGLGAGGHDSTGWGLVSKGCVSLEWRFLKGKGQNTVLKVHSPDLCLPP